MGKTQELTAPEIQIRRLYMQDLLSKAGFLPDDFIIEPMKQGIKNPIAIGIYVPATNVARVGTLKEVKLFLDNEGISNEPGQQNSFHLYVKYADVNVPESFKEEQKNQANIVRAENGNGNGTKHEEVNIFAPLEKILYLHEVLAFEESRDEQFAIFILPDKVEAGYMKTIMNFFLYNCDSLQIGDFIEVTVYNNTNVELTNISLLKEPSVTDHSRFTNDLLDSILITKWEIRKSKMQVIPSSEFLANDATKSTRFTTPPSKTNEVLVTNFVVEMDVKYGVDIQQDEKDKNTFFVLSPKDLGHAGSAEAKITRRQKDVKSSTHAVTKLLIESGFVCQNSKITQGVLCFQLHYFPGTKKPESIGLVYGTEEEKKEEAKSILTLLLENGYNVFLTKNGTGVKFNSNNLPKINVVAKSLGIHQYSHTAKTKYICYSGSKTTKGWKPIAIVGTGSREDKLATKNRFIDGLEKAGYEIRGVKKDTLLFYVKVEAEVVAKPETPIAEKLEPIIKPKKKFLKGAQSFANSLDKIIEEEADKLSATSKFANAMTEVFLAELESNLELQQKVMTKLKDKIAPGLDKKLLANLLAGLVVELGSKTFEIPGTGIKCINITDVTALIDQTISGLDE
ncbi:hypothetical protein A3J61_00490 [Candidatus Nomurabacteria bacterium RIFCSPHIGHO2_02_FULL_38_15]|uniref:Uncharacterized protein n=1 Tax=Candidatus Nomurabacteria bacterium RIFCSPHIGHO2_02_FULL_38_15 TaxID=1801752 RepID=A0A1F6VQK9_9BACT|nr:MAG: hypothetical protein A3J61_00490 [Candidatus Nomurabacteria bacterium RIFCSPHIGHO2_02_FULL_38_15]